MDLTPGYSFELLPIKTLTSIEGLRQKIKEPITCHDKRLLVNLLYSITRAPCMILFFCLQISSGRVLLRDIDEWVFERIATKNLEKNLKI